MINWPKFKPSLPLVLFLALTVTPCLVESNDVLTVNLDDPVGQAGDPVASGFHGGWLDVFPDSLVMPLKPSAFRGIVLNYEPLEMDSIWVRAKELDFTVIVLMEDPFDRGGGLGIGDQWWFTYWTDSPCGEYDEMMSKWKNHVGVWADYIMAHRVVGGDTIRTQYDIWNEPDLDDFQDCYGDDFDLFFDIWKTAVDTIRQVDDLALISGPSVAVDVDGAGDFMDVFLDSCLANDVMPDVLAWHDILATFMSTESVENGDPDPDGRNLYAQVVYARYKLTTKGESAGDYTYAVNEMLDKPYYLRAGVIVRNVALAERARIDGLGLELAATTYWCDPCDTENYDDCEARIVGSIEEGQMGGTVDPCDTTKSKRYAWWAHKAYADLVGSYVEIGAPSGVDGLATRVDSASSAQALVGGFASHDSTLSVRFLGLHDIDGLVVNDVVHVRAERIPGDASLIYVGGAGPETIIDERRLVFGDSLDVTITGFHDYDAITIKLAPIVPTTVPAPG